MSKKTTNQGAPAGADDEDQIDRLADIGAGEEVPDDLEDDAERDERLAREEAEGKGKTEGVDRDAVVADMKSAMNEAGADPDATVPAAKKSDGKPDGKPDGKSSDQEQPAGDKGKKPADGEQTEEAKAEAARLAEVDREADELRLRGKSRERFHEMSAKIHEQGSIIDSAMKIAGVDDPRKLAEVVAQQHEFEDAIFSTGLTAEDFKTAAGYKTCMMSNDPSLWQNARAWLVAELAEVDKRLGFSKDGGGDLLDDHPDLKAELEAGGKRDLLEEIARARNVAKASETARKRGHEQQQQYETAQQTAVRESSEFAAAAAAADPAQWAAKWPALEPLIRNIRATKPPERWATEIAFEYARLPYRPAAGGGQGGDGGNGQGREVQRPRAGAQPARGARTVPQTRGEPRKELPTDPMEALRSGLRGEG